MRRLIVEQSATRSYKGRPMRCTAGVHEEAAQRYSATLAGAPALPPIARPAARQSR
jgi:hypothetical protein